MTARTVLPFVLPSWLPMRPAGHLARMRWPDILGWEQASPTLTLDGDPTSWMPRRGLPAVVQRALKRMPGSRGDELLPVVIVRVPSVVQSNTGREELDITVRDRFTLADGTQPKCLSVEQRGMRCIVTLGA